MFLLIILNIPLFYFCNNLVMSYSDGTTFDLHIFIFVLTLLYFCFLPAIIYIESKSKLEMYINMLHLFTVYNLILFIFLFMLLCLSFFMEYHFNLFSCDTILRIRIKVPFFDFYIDRVLSYEEKLSYIKHYLLKKQFLLNYSDIEELSKLSSTKEIKDSIDNLYSINQARLLEIKRELELEKLFQSNVGLLTFYTSIILAI